MDQEFELQELSGSVETVIYRNEDNGYTVLRLRDSNGELVTVVGTFPYAAAGESMIISGRSTIRNARKPRPNAMPYFSFVFFPRTLGKEIPIG